MPTSANAISRMVSRFTEVVITNKRGNLIRPSKVDIGTRTEVVEVNCTVVTKSCSKSPNMLS